MRPLLLSLVFLFPAVGQSYLPFAFEPNIGQFPPTVRFVRRASGNLMHVTRDAFVLRNGVRIQIADVAPNVIPEGDSPSSTVYNFYQGSNSSGRRTSVRMFDAVSLANIYPGVSARFTTSTMSVSDSFSVGQGKVILTIQPGADLGRFRLRVLNTGAIPFEGPGGIWFAGGRIPGVFRVSIQSAQVDGEKRVPIVSTLRIESAEVLSVAAPSRDPALPAEVEIAFPSYDIVNRSTLPVQSTDGNRYLTSSVEQPSDFGEDGALDSSKCSGRCSDAVLARLDDSGKAIWVSLFGGEREEFASFATPSMNGVAVSGTTTSDDFPLTSNAPRSTLGSTRDVFLALFDRDSGQLRNATYSGIEGAAWPQQQAVDSGRDLAVGGGYSTSTSTVTGNRGYLLRWNPSENRFVFSVRFDSPVMSVAFDSRSNLYFASTKPLPRNTQLTTGVVDASGKQQGSLVTINVPAESRDAQFSEIQVLPAAGGEVWTVYQLRGLLIAKISPERGQVILTRLIASSGTLADLAFTPAGNLKLLVQRPSLTEATTSNAPLVAACRETSYFLIISPSAQIVYATYVPNATFDFAGQNETQSPAPARLGCFTSAAGRLPNTAVAPGQLITITGGGFGPASPIYYSPDSGGKYPLTAGGFRVRIAGMDAHIIAVARGLISAQVPYEVGAVDVPRLIEVFDNGTPLNPLPFFYSGYLFGLFDTGDRDNPLNLPALAALNQDGTVNSKSNPASIGSIVSLFGTGLGALSPALISGGLSPIPPSAPLSQSTLLRACRGCEILYMGSAPGLSTSVIQVNVRILRTEADGEFTSGVRPHGIGMAASALPSGLFIASSSGVVFIKD